MGKANEQDLVYNSYHYICMMIVQNFMIVPTNNLEVEVVLELSSDGNSKELAIILPPTAGYTILFLKSILWDMLRCTYDYCKLIHLWKLIAVMMGFVKCISIILQLCFLLCMICVSFVAEQCLKFACSQKHNKLIMLCCR